MNGAVGCRWALRMHGAERTKEGGRGCGGAGGGFPPLPPLLHPPPYPQEGVSKRFP